MVGYEKWNTGVVCVYSINIAYSLKRAGCSFSKRVATHGFWPGFPLLAAAMPKKVSSGPEFPLLVTAMPKKVSSDEQWTKAEV